MATRKTNKTTKGSPKQESEFDADKFLADWDAKERQPIPKGAIRGMPDKQPHPDMHYDVNHWAWIQNNPPKSDDNNMNSDTTMDNTIETVKTVEPVESTTMDKAITPVTPAETVTTNKVTEAKPESAIGEQSAKSPKSTRISGRMRRASRDEFCETYTCKVDTKGGSPITIAPDILKMAHVICAKSGNYKSCPTYVINNILRTVFEDMADEIKSWPMPE